MKLGGIIFQLGSYTIVQLIAVSLEYGIFAVINEFVNADIIVNNVVSKLIAGIFAVWAHSRFVFKTGQFQVWMFVKYISLLAINMLFSSLMLTVFVGVVGVYFGKIIADGIMMLGNFAIARAFVFTAR